MKWMAISFILVILGSCQYENPLQSGIKKDTQGTSISSKQNWVTWCGFWGDNVSDTRSDCPDGHICCEPNDDVCCFWWDGPTIQTAMIGVQHDIGLPDGTDTAWYTGTITDTQTINGDLFTADFAIDSIH